MNEAFRTYVSSPSGNTHSGDGDQYNLELSSLVGLRALLPDPRGRRSHLIASEDLLRLSRAFVPPRGLGAARDSLCAQRTVLLVGEPGTGRHSAALTLLWELRRERGRLHRLEEEQAADEEPSLSPHLVEEEDRIFLDLTATDETRTRELLETLPAFRATVLEKRAFLTVTLPTARGHLVPDQLAPFTVALERPDAPRVLRRHLLAGKLEPAAAELRDERLTNYLRRASMGGTARLARAILQRRERGPGLGFARWLDGALTDLAPQSPHVATKVKTLSDGRELALFLTSALLRGARADVVSVAADSMVRAVAHPPDEAPLLHRPALTDRLGAVGARVTADGRIEMEEDFAAAVRAYFWDNYPGLREQLVPWAERTVSLPLLDQRDRYGFVNRYAEQCLRRGTPQDLVALVARWAKTWQRKERMSAAARALSVGVEDRRYGGYFRHQIYEWSRQSELPAPLAHLLVGVCENVMAVDHPSQALTRLLHLARRGRNIVGRDSRHALLRLAHGDVRLFRRLLFRLTEHESGGGRADSRLFLGLTEPARLTASTDDARPFLSDAAVRDRLAVGWARVLRNLPREEWAGPLDIWLAEAARAQPDAQGQLLDVLVTSCSEDLPRLSGLYRHVRDWSAGGEPERGLYDRFWARCAAVLEPEPRTQAQGTPAREAP